MAYVLSTALCLLDGPLPLYSSLPLPPWISTSFTALCPLYGPLSPQRPSVLSTVHVPSTTLCPPIRPSFPSTALCPLYSPLLLYSPLSPPRPSVPSIRPSVPLRPSVPSTALYLLYGSLPTPRPSAPSRTLYPSTALYPFRVFYSSTASTPLQPSTSSMAHYPLHETCYFLIVLPNDDVVSLFRERCFAETGHFAKQRKQPLLFHVIVKLVSRTIGLRLCESM
jgi:hypothetical protein